jgi:sec-independent protein translocase protein TatC
LSVASDESEIEASRAPLLDHLIELRSRLIICAAALAAGFLICFFFSTNILVFLLTPFERAQALLAVQNAAGAHRGPFDLMLAMAGLKSMAGVHVQQVHMVFTAPLEIFFEKLKLSGFGAIVLTFPILAWQLYRFIAPGLYKRERHAFLPFLIASPVLFLMGAALVYFVMLPFVLWFSLNQQIVGDSAISVQLLPKVSDYLSLVTTLLLGFGLCFQLPVILSLLGMVGMVSSQFLRSGRRYAILAVFVVAAVLTPPDPISMMSLAIPGLLLYEVSILCVWLIERRRVRDEADDAAANPT